MRGRSTRMRSVCCLSASGQRPGSPTSWRTKGSRTGPRWHSARRRPPKDASGEILTEADAGDVTEDHASGHTGTVRRGHSTSTPDGQRSASRGEAACMNWPARAVTVERAARPVSCGCHPSYGISFWPQSVCDFGSRLRQRDLYSDALRGHWSGPECRGTHG